MTIDTKVRILWLSDIHYDKNYTDKNKNELLKNYISSFLVYCSKLIDIDYILLSGDIAQSGIKEEYNLFFNDILEPLLKLPRLEKAKLLVIPGNHDVNRETNPFFKKFITEITKQDFKRNVFLSEEINSFEKAFEQYSSSFQKFSNRVPEKINSNYKEQFLHGYFTDHTKKIIFILLNSSWYSFGNKFIDKYFEEFLVYDAKEKTFTTQKSETQIKKELQKIAEEYGSQVVNMDVFDRYNNLKQEIKLYNDYIVIQSLHHPFNWLDWDERINYNNDKNKFLLLKNQTDILLTGHEHVPKEHNPDYLNDKNLLHIPAGCFMEKQNPKDFDIKNNWFSILNINTKKRTVIQQKIVYSKDKNKWFSKESEVKELNKKYDSHLDSSRKDNLLDEIEKLYQTGSIIDVITKKNRKKRSIEKLIYSSNNVLYIPLKKNFDLVDSNVLKSMLINKKNIFIVNFIFVDLLLDEKDDYINKKDKLEVLSDIKEKIDFSFDKYRHCFFSSLNNQEIEHFENTKFVLKLIPFWEVESFIYADI
jgi:predicted phosphodiesterase